LFIETQISHAQCLSPKEIFNSLINILIPFKQNLFIVLSTFFETFGRKYPFGIGYIYIFEFSFEVEEVALACVRRQPFPSYFTLVE